MQPESASAAVATTGGLPQDLLIQDPVRGTECCHRQSQTVLTAAAHIPKVCTAQLSRHTHMGLEVTESTRHTHRDWR